VWLCLFGSSLPAQQTPTAKSLYQKRELMIPMRDGTKLYTALYIPKDKPGKHPILMERTPYGAGPYGADLYRNNRGSKQFVTAGYIFAYQDVRGMGKSEGVFVNDRPQLLFTLRPNDVDESTDTYDTVDYLVRNVPECNGRVGLWGISYPGFYAGVGAINTHPALKAVSPQAPVSDWFIGDDFHHNGALFLMDAVSFARFGQSRIQRDPASQPRIDTQGDPFKFYLETGSLANLTEKYFKETDGMWRYLVLHGNYDEYWQARSLPRSMKNVKCAVLVVGGWFDAEDCWGALNTYKGTEAQNKGIANTLVMGPWWHGMWASPVGQTFGALDFGQATSTYFQDKIEFPFFDTHLRGDGKQKRPEAEVFETGANRWRTFPKWPPAGRTETAFYLLPDKKVATEAPGTSATEYDEYVSDPANPVPYQGGQIRSRTREYMIDDQRFATARPDVLSYQTPVMTENTTFAGPITADLFVSTTGTDADFVVKIIDVFPDDAPGKLAGYQMLVRAEVMRGKFRKSYANPSPFTPGQVEEVKYELPDVCHTFQKGHRLMVQVQSSWFPLVDRNPQTFTDIYTAKDSDFQKATIRLYHSPSYRSCVRVGLLK
jgi:putative CocE/NonD family hydrolase